MTFSSRSSNASTPLYPILQTMASLANMLGLHSAWSSNSTPNYAPAFLGFHFVWVYCALASRTMKQIYGLDHNVSPRRDLAKYGDAAVKSGKITQRQLDMMHRCEAAQANATENFILFASAIGFATFSGVDRDAINRAGMIYTIGRVAHSVAYIAFDTPALSLVRSVAWWIGNVSCLWMLRLSYVRLNVA